MIKQVQIGKRYLMVGGNWQTFSIGFTIDKYGLAINLGFVWIAFEL